MEVPPGQDSGENQCKMELWDIGCEVEERRVDCGVESREVKYVRTVKRILEEQRWDANNLKWVTLVPWNRERNDKEADGDLPEFHAKKGPGRQVMEEEKQDIATSVAPKIIHRAQFRMADVGKHSYAD